MRIRIHYLSTILAVALPILAQSQDFHPTGSIIPDEIKAFWEGRRPLLKYDPGRLLASVDWSANDSPVKNQGSCGSCWAFAAVALIENLGTQTDLAEQVIVSCATGSCSGGWYGYALQYIHDYGIPWEACYPYTATNGDCDNKCSDPPFLERMASYDRWGRWGETDETTVNNLRSLLNTGPVLVHMLVPTDGSFNSYKSGIYDYTAGLSIPDTRGHAVLVVGYNDSEGSFKVKNSWGTGWGDKGYFRIAYNDVTDSVRFGGYACMASGVYTEFPEVETLTQPGTPEGETTPFAGASYTYQTGGSTSNLGHTIQYQFAWGDGSYSSWSTSKTASHVWAEAGSFSIIVTARCATHTTVISTSETLSIEAIAVAEELTYPGKPSGNTQPWIGILETYETNGSTSNLGHAVQYRFSWGDGSYSDWSESRSASHAWAATGSYNVSVTARCVLHNEITSESLNLAIEVTEAETITIPGKPQGTAKPVVGEPETYSSTGAASSLGHELEYRFSWGDGTKSSWLSNPSTTHSWASVGNYNVTVTARCTEHTTISSISSGLSISVQEKPESLSQPGTPEGEADPVMQETHSYTTTGSVSNLGHTVEYRFSWGDGSDSDWSTSTAASHQWSSAGSYSVLVTARCAEHTQITAESGILTVAVREPAETLTNPGIPQGETSPLVGHVHTYETTGSSSNLGHEVEYSFDWGDGQKSSWSPLLSASHSWSSAGTYTLMVASRCVLHPDICGVSEGLSVEVSVPPEELTRPVTPEGETRPVIQETYAYTTGGAESSLGNDVEYCFLWGDGTGSPWSTSTSAEHQWDSLGKHIVVAVARSSENPEVMSCSDSLSVDVAMPSDVDDDPRNPRAFRLYQNAPNPFNPGTWIRFTLPSDGMVKVEVRNIMGQAIRILMQRTLQAGMHSIFWDGKNEAGAPVSAGIYLFLVRTETETSKIKGILMK